MCRPEQQTAVCIYHINTKFTKPFDFVVYLCAKPFSTARECSITPKYLWFVGFESDCAVAEDAKRAVVLSYAAQLLNNVSDINANDEALPDARVYKEEMDSLNASTFWIS